MEHSYERYKLRNQDSDVLRRTYDFLSEKLAAGVPVFGYFRDTIDWLFPLCESRTSVVPEFFGLQYLEDSGEVCFSVAENCVSEEDFDLIQELADLFETSFDVTQVVEWYENEWMKFGAERSFVAKDSVQLRRELSDKVAYLIQKYGTKEGVLSLDLERLPIVNGKVVTAVCMAEAEFTTGMEIVPHWRFSDGTSDPVYATNRSYVYSAVEQIDEIEDGLWNRRENALKEERKKSISSASKTERLKEILKQRGGSVSFPDCAGEVYFAKLFEPGYILVSRVYLNDAGTVCIEGKDATDLCKLLSDRVNHYELHSLLLTSSLYGGIIPFHEEIGIELNFLDKDFLLEKEKQAARVNYKRYVDAILKGRGRNKKVE